MGGSIGAEVRERPEVNEQKWATGSEKTEISVCKWIGRSRK